MWECTFYVRESVKRKPNFAHLYLGIMFQKEQSAYFSIFIHFSIYAFAAGLPTFSFQFRRKCRLGWVANRARITLRLRCCWNLLLLTPSSVAVILLNFNSFRIMETILLRLILAFQRISSFVMRSCSIASELLRRLLALHLSRSVADKMCFESFLLMFHLQTVVAIYVKIQWLLCPQIK